MEVGSENYRTRVGSMKFKSKYYRIRFGNMEVGIGHLTPHQSWHMTPRIRISGRHRTYPYLLSIGVPAVHAKRAPCLPQSCAQTPSGVDSADNKCRSSLDWIYIEFEFAPMLQATQQTTTNRRLAFALSTVKSFHQFPTSQAVISSPRNGYAKIIGHQCTQTQTCKYQKSSIESWSTMAGRESKQIRLETGAKP